MQPLHHLLIAAHLLPYQPAFTFRIHGPETLTIAKSWFLDTVEFLTACIISLLLRIPCRIVSPLHVSQKRHEHRAIPIANDYLEKLCSLSLRRIIVINYCMVNLRAGANKNSVHIRSGAQRHQGRKPQCKHQHHTYHDAVAHVYQVEQEDGDEQDSHGHANGQDLGYDNCPGPRKGMETFVENSLGGSFS